MSRIEEIILILLDKNTKHTIGTIAEKIWGRRNKKIPHDNVLTYINILISQGLIEPLQKDVDKKGGGAKGSIVKLKQDVETLKSLWAGYPTLHDKIRVSNYYKSVISKLIQRIIPDISEKTPNLKKLLRILVKISPTTIEIALGFYPDWGDVARETRMIQIHGFELKKIASELKDLSVEDRNIILVKISYLFLVAFVKDSLDQPELRKELKRYLTEASEKMRYLPAGE
jgi:hypothetical protein